VNAEQHSSVASDQRAFIDQLGKEAGLSLPEDDVDAVAISLEEVLARATLLLTADFEWLTLPAFDPRWHG
jgi:hypothetical protein